MKLWLEETELSELTGRTQTSAQARALDAMGIRYIWNADGNLRVGRLHVERVLCGDSFSQSERKKPNFEALQKAG